MIKLRMMNISSAIFFILIGVAAAGDCPAKKTAAKLICYYGKLTDVDSCKCTHVVLPANSDVKGVDRLRESLKGVKILITVNEFNQGLVNILKSSKVDGVEINLQKLDSKNDINDFISTVKSKFGSDLYVVLSVPPRAETLAKYYDFKTLSKNADLFVLQTAFLGASKNVTFHPSRLSGLWDMQNTDSVVDLVSGLGAPLSKLVITSPVQAFKFKLQSEKHTAPGSPALEVSSITRDELCKTMKDGANWTLERDQDQTGPYIFRKDQWIAFEDATSIDIKAKYARVRGLAGMAFKDMSQDGGTKCESSILDAAYNGLSRQARAPRGAVLHSLEREILETPARPLDTIQVSPYRISRVIDVEGNVHVIRQDTRTEFECARQGYFVHPRSCGRFYRCVKFDQLSEEFSVFEFDCPAGLAFDSRYEVCVWPGSLPHASPCSGSSEIAPVPRERFVCPGQQGYYADPENCRWFFACLDHGKSPLSAYEFRCPFGLVFDESRLLCEWPWLVPKCGNGYAAGSQVVYGGTGLVALDQYDGLGVLGATALGGLHGPLEQPVAKVYSNVGTVGLVSQGIGSGHLGQQTYLINGNQGYSAGIGGLSVKAAESLQNAGLLNVQYIQGLNDHGGQASGVAYTTGSETAGNVGSFGLKIGQTAGSGLSYTQSQDTSQNIVHQGSGFGVASQQGFLHDQNANAGHTSSGLAFTTNTGSHLTNAGVYQGTDASDVRTNSYDQDYNLNYQVGSSGALGVKTTEGFGANIRVADGGVATGTTGYSQDSSGAHLVNGLAYYGGFGAKSQQNFAQYHGSSGAGVSSGAAQSSDGTYSSGASLSSHGTYSSGSALSSGGSYSSGGAQSSDSAYSSGAAQSSGGTYSAGATLSSDASYSSGDASSSGGTYSSGAAASSDNTYSSGGALSSGGSYSSEAALTSGGSYSSGAALSSDSTYSSGGGLSSGGSYSSGATLASGGSYTSGDVLSAGGSYSSGASLTSQNTDQQVDISNYDASKSTIEYHGNTGEAYGNGISGKTNIIGGGYSAVGVAHSGIEITNYGQHTNAVSHVTPSPISVTTVSAIPTVTSVPVPALKVASGFQSYKGGVVANVPELQYKVQRPVSNVYYQANLAASRGSSGFANHSTSYVNLVSSTPSTVAVDDGYHYPKPTVAFVEGPAKATSYHQQNIGASITTYQKPLIVSTTQAPFVENVNIQYHQPIVSSTQIPLVEQKVNIQPIITTYQKPVSTASYVQHHVTNVQPVVTTYQQPTVSSTATPVTYNVQNEAAGFVGYDYPKPAVTFEETSGKAVGGSFSYQNVNAIRKNEGYTYSKPAVAFEETPLKTVNQAAVSTFSYSAPSTVKPVTVVEQVQPVVQVQPTVHTGQQAGNQQGAFSYSHFQNYNDQQNYDEKSQIQVSSYNAPSSTVTPIIQQSPQVYVSSTPASVVQQKVVQPAVVSSFSISGSSEGYNYPRPSVAFEEKPAVSTYYQSPIIPVKSGLSSYKFKNIIQSIVNKGYSYAQPTITYQETPASVTQMNVQQPAVVSSYSYSAPSTVKPAVVLEQQQPVFTYVASSTPRPQVVVQKQPSVVSSYSFTASSTPRPAVAVGKQVEFSGYDYPKPAVQFSEEPGSVVTSYENRQPVEEVPFEKKTAYVTGGKATSYQQFNNVASVQLEQKPLVVENYQAPVVSSTPLYQYQQPVAIQKNVVVSSTPRYEIRQQYSNVDSGYVYEKPSIAFEEQPLVVQNYQVPVVSSTLRPVVNYNYVQSTPRPTFSSTISSVVAAKRPVELQPFRFYDSRLSSTARPVTYSTSVPIVQTVTTSKPIAKYSFSSLDDQYQSVSVSAPVKNVENYVAQVSSTPSPQYLPARVQVTTSAPTETYVVPEVVTPVSNYGLRVSTQSPIEISTPTREYLPARARVKVTTSAPTEVYSLPEVTTPSREYLPVRTRVKVTTPASTYLPVPKTIVKVNDFHPLLSAKLGAQCTCVSNSVRLRNKPLRVVVNDDDDDGYVVDNNDNGVVVENYEYNPQKVVDITPTPEIYIKSTTNAIVEPSPTPVYAVRKRVRVRPATSTVVYDAPVTQAAEIFLRKAVTPAVTFVSTEAPISQGAGLNLIEQTNNAGARGSIESKNFDRYGPGGLRSKNERLQGTIDCQRAGLFRHPTQCNKFYACRWDCTKNKYTLHVFNCPVHLTFDNTLGACNWPSQGPACLENTLLPSD